MMLKDDFVRLVVKFLPGHLSENYKDAEIVIEEVVKFNEKYLGLTLKRDSEEAVPYVNLDEFYEKYQICKRLQWALTDMAELLEKDTFPIDFDVFKDYEKAKEHLMLRVCNISRNQDYLKSAVHTSIADLAVTYGIAIEFEDRGLQITTVSREMLDVWGISAGQLHEDAVKSSINKFPPLLSNLADIIPMPRPINNLLMDEKPVDIPFDRSPFYLLTNTEGIEGASVLFYPEIMGKAAMVIGKDYTIIPSSIHEVLLISDSAEISLSELKNMIRSANDRSGTVKPNEILGYEPYHYDSNGKIFETAESFASRMAKKDSLDKRIASAEEKLAEPEKGDKEKEVINGERDEGTL